MKSITVGKGIGFTVFFYLQNSRQEAAFFTKLPLRMNDDIDYTFIV